MVRISSTLRANFGHISPGQVRSSPDYASLPSTSTNEEPGSLLGANSPLVPKLEFGQMTAEAARTYSRSSSPITLRPSGAHFEKTCTNTCGRKRRAKDERRIKELELHGLYLLT